MRYGTPPGSDSGQPPEEAAALLGLLHEELVQLARVEEDALAVRAAIDLDPAEVLFLQVVTAFRALHEMGVPQPLALRGGLLLGALPLATLPGHARRLQELLLVLPEPLVLAAMVVLQETSCFGIGKLSRKRV